MRRIETTGRRDNKNNGFRSYDQFEVVSEEAECFFEQAKFLGGSKDLVVEVQLFLKI